MSERIVNDIVHGIIKLPDYIQSIINTNQFQRLRYISQLGLDSFVYPSAGYSRFEHSIGTFHLASKLIKQIKKQLFKDHAEKKVSKIDIKCVEIAALCHELGHGPYSHFWEQALDERIPTRKHEIISAEIFEELVKIKAIRDKIGFENKITAKTNNLIKRIISGNIKTKDKEKYFLFEIVANKQSGLDVDKFDYLCRDSIYLGWSNKNKIHDVKRIMHFLRVVKDESKNEWHLAMRDREIFHIHDVFYYRHLLHRYGYQHKTVKAIECLFKKAIKEIVDNEEHRDEFIKNVLIKTECQYDTTIWFSTEFISKVCDHHVWEIMKKYTKDIVKQIQERNMIKLHCQIQVFRKEKNQVKLFMKSVESLRERLEQIPDVEPEDLIRKLNEISTIGNSIHENVEYLIKQLNKVSDLYLINFSASANDIIKKFKQVQNLPDNSNINNKINIIKENIKSLSENVGDLPEFVIENNQNGNIHDDLKYLTDILKQIDGVAEISISKFSLQSEDQGNPLLAVRFYRKNDQSKCFHMKEEDLPDLAKLKRDEVIIMIFKEEEENNKKMSPLDDIITELCSEYFNENSFDSMQISEKIKNLLKDEIKNLRGKYTFRKNLY